MAWFVPGYTETSPFYTHFTYILAHANPVHLFINMFVFWKVYDRVGIEGFIAGLMAGILASFIAYSKETVGASGLIFGMMGFMYVVRTISFKNYLIVAFWITVGSLIGLLSQNVNIMLHLVALFIGVVIGFVYSLFIWASIKL